MDRPETPDANSDNVEDIEGESGSVCNHDPVDLYPQKPVSILISDRRYWSRIVNSIRGLWDSLCLVAFSVHEREPGNPVGVEIASGRIGEKALQLCELMYSEERSISKDLEEKARKLFSLMAILTPLLVAGVPYFFSSAASTRAYSSVMVLCSFGFIILSFVAAIRAVAVKATAGVGLTAVIDEKLMKIKKYSCDSHGRLLLWCAAQNRAVNALLADFVKSSQRFLIAATAMLILAFIPQIYFLPSAKDEKAKLNESISSLLAHQGEIVEEMARQSEALEKMVMKFDVVGEAIANKTEHQREEILVFEKLTKSVIDLSREIDEIKIDKP